jgi:phosphoglycolate phosphatase
MKFKAAVFDLDGTLLDTLEDIADSMNSVLLKHGHPIHDVEPYKYFVGDGFRNLVFRALPESMRSDPYVDNCYSEVREEYAKRWNNKTKAYDGISEMLDELSYRGLKLSVLSNKSDDFAKLMIKQLLPHWRFYPVYGERYGIPKKPDPAAAVEISGILGVRPDECLYLGDTGVDMTTAVSAGMFAVGVLWGFRKADELLANGANMLVREPLEVLKLI